VIDVSVSGKILRNSYANKNVLGMIATGDGRLLLCNYSGEPRGVVVYGENGKHIKTVKLNTAPFDIAFISRTDQYVVILFPVSGLVICLTFPVSSSTEHNVP
jgi:hypothetical protein